ncbi:tRNA (adenosine(37)-N6)-threonylcarbamoyltransferase complex dimerization subunit type 1 TsaB [Allohahella sp. A8]|uniref:tRNA (adenosine(37)-N6)-threonylcarbamoyltransferase complex dimerization subunit type 1 TsaB n=1 Tax=Allohahella sp. A8 TaxID=3141461 RepID=UPI003A7FC0BD
MALLCQGQLSSLSESAARAHARRLLPMANELITAAGLASVSEIDVLAFDAGPGGFTGLRIAAALVQGLAFAGGQSVAGISSLHALAWQRASEEGLDPGDRFACVIDARMAEVYWQIFEVADKGTNELPFRAVGEAQLSTPEACLAQLEAEAVRLMTGDYFAVSTSAPDELRVVIDQPSAESIALLAARRTGNTTVEMPAAAIPVYLRGASAWKKTTHKTDPSN